MELLRKDFPNVYSNKINSRIHTRKYLSVVLQMGKYHYYVTMSLPKDSDYQITGANKVIKKIISNAKVMYNQKVSKDTTAGYVKSALDFQALEALCAEYERERADLC